MALPMPLAAFSKPNPMADNRAFDVIIIGGSYSGLAAAMALGRALKKVLVIDSGKPCNRQTPHSHNFLTQDGKTPAEISKLARKQVAQYDTVSFLSGQAVKGCKKELGFIIETDTGQLFKAKKLVFATGIKDIISTIPGLSECWGISVLHCPYCHGYEVRYEQTGILANGENAFELATLISNWTDELTVYTNGKSTLTIEQTAKLEKHGINVVEREIKQLEHTAGYIKSIVFQDGTTAEAKAIYVRSPFEQHSTIPQSLGCELTEEGYIKVNTLQETTVPGVYASGDSTNKMRTVANAVATGTTAGMAASKKLIIEAF